MQLPNVVSKFNSFEDMTAILKNRGMIAEAKKEEVTAYKKPEVDPIDLIAPDLLDDGIRAELEAKGIEGTPSEEEYTKAKEKAAKNLAKDPLHYKNAQTMPEMGEKMTPDESKAAASNFGYPKGSQRLNSEENKETSDMTYRHGGKVKMASGGSASSRADGIAVKGKTRGKMC